VCCVLKAMEKAKASEDASGSASLRTQGWSVFILASTAVLREGIESVIFLAGGCHSCCSV